MLSFFYWMVILKIEPFHFFIVLDIYYFIHFCWTTIFWNKTNINQVNVSIPSEPLFENNEKKSNLDELRSIEVVTTIEQDDTNNSKDKNIEENKAGVKMNGTTTIDSILIFKNTWMRYILNNSWKYMIWERWIQRIDGTKNNCTNWKNLLS